MICTILTLSQKRCISLINLYKAGVNMKKHIKSISLVLLSIIMLVNLSGCSGDENKTILDLPEYSHREMYDDGGWQDILVFNKYYYDNIDKYILNDSRYLQKITADNIEEVNEYVVDFEKWIEASNDKTKAHYDFDKSMIEKGDYYYIEDDRPDIESFTVYYFDVESQLLYYMLIKW